MRREPVGMLNKVEKLLMRTVILTAVLLVVVQALVVNDPFSTVMARVGTDTTPAVETTAAHWSEPRITLYLENYSALPHLVVLVNGNKMDVFDDRYVTIPVQDGDRVEIDSTFYSNEVLVKVLNTTADVIIPMIDKQLALKNNIVPVCTVKLKQ